MEPRTAWLNIVRWGGRPAQLGYKFVALSVPTSESRSTLATLRGINHKAHPNVGYFKGSALVVHWWIIGAPWDNCEEKTGPQLCGVIDYEVVASKHQGWQP